MVRSQRVRVLGVSLSVLARLGLVGAGVGLLAACQETPSMSGGPRAYQPIPPQTLALMTEKGTTKQSPMLIRTYKKEAEFEIWKMRSDGKYALLKTYPMCRWSGQLGPKVKEGDRQVPEGFYAITPGQMNPNSAYYLSFNVGYPNAYHMNAENFAKHRADPNIEFWKQLKEGADNFEVTKAEPKVGVCGRHYVFNETPENPGQRLEADAASPPLKPNTEIATLVKEKQQQDEQKIAELTASGIKPVRLVYADGGQHPDFFSKMPEVSRPDALAEAPIEIDLSDSKLAKSSALQLAAAKSRLNGGTTNVTAYAPTQTASIPATSSPSSAIEANSSSGSSWLGLKRLFGSDDQKSESTETASPQPTKVPLPPKRAAGAPSTPKPQASLPKPQASLERSNAAGSIAKLIEGSLPALPDGFLAYAPTR